MDKDKPKEHRRNGSVFPKRERLANLLSANVLKLGAGATFCVFSCGLVSGFAAADDGQIRTKPVADQQISEIRLKSVGATISFQPIAQPSRAASVVEPTQPRLTPIKLDPMTGDSGEMLDQPVFAGQKILERFVDVPVSEQGHSNHPRILSIRRLDLKSTVESPAVVMHQGDHAAADPRPEAPASTDAQLSLPPSILVETLDSDSAHKIAQATSFTFSDAAPAPPENADELLGGADEMMENVVGLASSLEEPMAEAKAIENLPLLPVPNRQWVASQTNDKTNDEATPKHADQHTQHVKLTAPQTISVAHVKRMSTPHVGAGVPAKLSGYARPARAATPQPSVVSHPRVSPQPNPIAKPLDATALMMKEIQDRYPDAQVVLVNSDGQLVVRGNCSNRKHATAIIRMIRGRLLIPVDDCLVIR